MKDSIVHQDLIYQLDKCPEQSTEYKEYHTSLDNKKFMNIKKITKSINEIDFFLVYDQLSETDNKK